MSATSDEDSGPGVNRHRDPVAWERLRTHSKRLDEIGERVGAMDEEISDFKKVQIVQGTKIETLIGFHEEIKKYARWAVMGLVGVIGMQVLQLVLAKPSSATATANAPVIERGHTP